MTGAGSAGPSKKVARLIEEYDLEGTGDELVARWTGDGTERESLRDLETFFNKQLLEAAMLETGVSSLGHDVDRLYRNLVDAGVSAGVEQASRTHLEQWGVDVDSLERDFVTYQAIRSYLTEWRGVEYEHVSDSEKVANDIETLTRLQARTESIAETRIENLRNTDRLAIADFEVFATVQVLCQRCGTQYEVGDFLERGGCACQEE